MSESTSFSSSTSTPTVPAQEVITQTILNSIAGVAANYANTLYNWGQGVFNGLSGDISGIMGKLSAAADTAMSGATTAEGQFTGSFIPDYNALRTEAGQYANPARQERNAGMAESSQMQAGRSAMNDALQKLESQGIDTSSGRYAHDLLSAETGSAAAAAGAGTQSIRADEQTALALKKQALDMGIQMPGIAANFLNQANQANSVSGNLDIGKTNAGTALMQLPNAYLSTAMQDRFPPIGNEGRSSSTSQSSRPDPNSNQSGANRSSNNNGLAPPVFGPNGGTPSPSAFSNPNSSNTNTGGGTPFGGSGAGAHSINVEDNPYAQFDGSSFDNISSPQFTDNSAGNNIDLGGQTDPFSGTYGGTNTSYDQFGSYDPSSTYNNPYGFGNPTADNFSMGSAPSDWADYNPQIQNTDQSDAFSGAQQPYQSYDTSGGDYSGGDYSDYAEGGEVPSQGNATTGGYVPQSASPSQGQQTDDIHASLNADEFVVPKDVSLWKGQEFFQKLIAQSRKNLATAQAQGKPSAPPQGPVRFASRPMGQ